MEKEVNPTLIGAKNGAMPEKIPFNQLDRLALLIHFNFAGLT